MKPWKILSSRQTYKDKWLGVRTDTVELANGAVIPDFHIIEYKEWAAILAFTEDGELFFTSRNSLYKLLVQGELCYAEPYVRRSMDID